MNAIARPAAVKACVERRVGQVPRPDPGVVSRDAFRVRRGTHGRRTSGHDSNRLEGP